MPKRSQKRSVTKKTATIAFFVVIAIYLICSIISVQSSIYHKKSELQTINAEISEMENLNREMNMYLNAYTDKEYIEKVAREKLNYAYPNERIYVNAMG